jgi:hypothetical protein
LRVRERGNEREREQVLLLLLLVYLLPPQHRQLPVLLPKEGLCPRLVGLLAMQLSLALPSSSPNLCVLCLLSFCNLETGNVREGGREGGREGVWVGGWQTVRESGFQR